MILLATMFFTYFRRFWSLLRFHFERLRWNCDAGTSQYGISPSYHNFVMVGKLVLVRIFQYPFWEVEHE